MTKENLLDQIRLLEVALSKTDLVKHAWQEQNTNKYLLPQVVADLVNAESAIKNAERRIMQEIGSHFVMAIP